MSQTHQILSWTPYFLIFCKFGDPNAMDSWVLCSSTTPAMDHGQIGSVSCLSLRLWFYFTNEHNESCCKNDRQVTDMHCVSRVTFVSTVGHWSSVCFFYFTHRCQCRFVVEWGLRAVQNITLRFKLTVTVLLVRYAKMQKSKIWWKLGAPVTRVLWISTKIDICII